MYMFDPATSAPPSWTGRAAVGPANDRASGIPGGVPAYWRVWQNTLLVCYDRRDQHGRLGRIWSWHESNYFHEVDRKPIPS